MGKGSCSHRTAATSSKTVFNADANGTLDPIQAGDAEASEDEENDDDDQQQFDEMIPEDGNDN